MIPLEEYIAEMDLDEEATITIRKQPNGSVVVLVPWD